MLHHLRHCKGWVYVVSHLKLSDKFFISGGACLKDSVNESAGPTGTYSSSHVAVGCPSCGRYSVYSVYLLFIQCIKCTQPCTMDTMYIFLPLWKLITLLLWQRYKSGLQAFAHGVGAGSPDILLSGGVFAAVVKMDVYS